ARGHERVLLGPRVVDQAVELGDLALDVVDAELLQHLTGHGRGVAGELALLVHEGPRRLVGEADLDVLGLLRFLEGHRCGTNPLRLVSAAAPDATGGQYGGPSEGDHTHCPRPSEEVPSRPATAHRVAPSSQ